MATTNTTTTWRFPDILIRVPHCFGDRRYEEIITVFIAAGGQIMQDGEEGDVAKIKAQVTWKQNNQRPHTKYLSISFLEFIEALEVATETRSSLTTFTIYLDKCTNIFRFAASRSEIIRFWQTVGKAIIAGAVEWESVTTSTELSSNNNNIINGNNNFDSLQWLLLLAHSVQCYPGGARMAISSKNHLGRAMFGKREPTNLLVDFGKARIESIPEPVNHSSSVGGIHSLILFSGTPKTFGLV